MLSKARAFLNRLSGASEAGRTPCDFAFVSNGLKTGSVALVDVREASEFAAGHAAGALNMPLSRFDPARLPPAGGPQVVLMCLSGARSAQALGMARASGRNDVLNYRGSMKDWTVRGGRTVRS